MSGCCRGHPRAATAASARCAETPTCRLSLALPLARPVPPGASTSDQATSLLRRTAQTVTTSPYCSASRFHRPSNGSAACLYISRPIPPASPSPIAPAAAPRPLSPPHDAMASGGSSRMPPRLHSRSNFTTRSAQDDDHQLQRRWSISQISSHDENDPLLPAGSRRGRHLSPAREPEGFAAFFSGLFSRGRELVASTSVSRATSVAPSLTPSGRRRHHGRHGRDRAHSRGRVSAADSSKPADASSKLGTFAGVFVPTTLNVLSILMFLRFGFILGQSGVLGMMAMLVACYAINFLTTLSISAIATNGTVRGGGAYYLISRSLGPEFGGSIGIVFYLGFVLNTGMNAVGLVACFVQDFGSQHGSWSNWLPDNFWWQYLWATVVLVVCTAICLAGSGIFARCSNALLVIVLVATFSIPISAFVQHPFTNVKLGIEYTGLSLETLKGNLLPRLTKGAAGSQMKGKETWQDLFGILFPATGGIFASAHLPS